MRQCINTASDSAFPFKHAICCTALGIRLCNGTLECTGICIPSTGRTLCSGDCAHCSGIRELQKQCVRGFPAGVMFYCCSVGFLSHGSCQWYVGGETGFSARWEWDQFLSCSCELLQKQFLNPGLGNSNRDLIPLKILWRCEIACIHSYCRKRSKLFCPHINVLPYWMLNCPVNNCRSRRNSLNSMANQDTSAMFCQTQNTGQRREETSWFSTSFHECHWRQTN